MPALVLGLAVHLPPVLGPRRVREDVRLDGAVLRARRGRVLLRRRGRGRPARLLAGRGGGDGGGARGVLPSAVVPLELFGGSHDFANAVDCYRFPCTFRSL